MSDGDFPGAAAAFDAAWAVLEDGADLVMQRSPRLSLDEVCARIGVDVDRVRAGKRRGGEDSDA